MESVPFYRPAASHGRPCTVIYRAHAICGIGGTLHLLTDGGDSKERKACRYYGHDVYCHGRYGLRFGGFECGEVRILRYSKINVHYGLRLDRDGTRDSFV